MTVVKPIRRGRGVPLATPEAKAGDLRAGFELAVDRPRRIVRLRMWGLWDLLIAEDFRRAMFKCARGLEGASWGILADSREFAAQTAAVSKIRSEMMQRVLPMGCARIGAVVDDAATYAMQFSRITGQSHMTAEVFRDEDIALAWVSEHRGDL